MEDLDQVAISKILGSGIKPIGHVGFGHFASVSTTEEIQKTLHGIGRSVEPPSFTYPMFGVKPPEPTAPGRKNAFFSRLCARGGLSPT
jgi:hypothetical protein